MRSAVVVLLLLSLAACASTPERIAEPAASPSIDLWPGVPPGSEGWTQKEIQHESGLGATSNVVVRNVTRPTITPYLPDPDKATGAAVLVAPGGAFLMLSMKSEGTDVARWLASRGIAAFVLKYRLNETPVSVDAFGQQILKFITDVATNKLDPAEQKKMLADCELAVADAQQALRLIRARASEWKIDPNRIGILGFSAGGMLTTRAILANGPAVRFNFAAPIYGVSVPDDAKLDASLPPSFLAVSSDDALMGKQTLRVAEQLRISGANTELHVFRRGGHGFGLNKHGMTSDHWIDEFFWWLGDIGMVGQK